MVGAASSKSDGQDEQSARRAFIVAALCALVLAVLALLVSGDRLTGVDTRDILAVRADASPILTQVMLAASLIAHGRVAIPFALVAAALIYRFAGRVSAVVYVIACSTGEGVMLLIKAIVRHHRPVGISPKLTDAGYFSFPSGHEMLAVIIFGFGTWLLTRHAPRIVQVLAMGAAVAFILLVGVSRVYLGAHWPSDVVGALVGGTGWTAFCVGWALRRTGFAAENGEMQRSTESTIHVTAAGR
jgi:undecaprenyl-diphosphatase